MRTLTSNEMTFVLGILKSPDLQYNASSIARLIGISRMGALKIARKLEKEHILVSKELGKARFYTLNIRNDFVKQYVRFLLQREAEDTEPPLKMWISELKKVKSADVAVLFGSVLRKPKEARDIDVLFITDQKRFSKLRHEIHAIEAVNIKKIHAIYQTREDFIKNIKKNDKAVLSALKGVVVFGDAFLIEVIQNGSGWQ